MTNQATERTKAEEFFEAEMRFQYLLNSIEDVLYEIHGWDDGSDDPEKHCPAENWTYNSYDYSWEWKDVRLGWLPTAEQQQAVYALGFTQFWVCYKDGSERFFHPCGDPSGAYRPPQPSKQEPKR